MARKKHTVSGKEKFSENSLEESESMVTESIIENDNSTYSNMRDKSIEDIKTSPSESVGVNSQSKKRKKQWKENKIDSEISELSASGESKIKRKKKKQPDIEEKQCYNSNVDLDNENNSEKEQKKSLKSKKEIEINDCDSCSIFSSESLTRSKHETSLDCAQTSDYVSPNKLCKENKKKESPRKTEDVLTYSEESALRENSPSKKNKKRLKENYIDDGELTVNGEKKIKKKHKIVLENQYSTTSESVYDEHNDLGTEHQKKRKKIQSKKDFEPIEHSKIIGVTEENSEEVQQTNKISKKNKHKSGDGPGKISDLDYDHNCGNMSGDYVTTRKEKKDHDNERTKKKSKKLMANENISMDENCKTGISENSNCSSNTGKKKDVEENTTSNAKKKCLSDFISSSLMESLTSKMDEIVRTESQRKSSEHNEANKKKKKKKDREEYNAINQDCACDATVNKKKKKDKLEETEKIECSSDFISPSLTDGATSKLDDITETKSRRKKSKHKKSSKKRDKSPPETDLHKILGASEGTELMAITDSDLNDLLSEFDEIVENEERHSKSVEEILEDVSQRNEGEGKKERKQNIEEKKKIIELLKTTKSIKRIREELNIKDDEGLEKLKCLDITLPWPLARVHQIARNVSCQPTQQQRKALEAEGIKLKLGLYSKAEDEKIKQNWKLFCKYHNWDENNYHPFVKGSNFKQYGVLDRANYRKFVKFISHNFENRLMYNIYLRFKRLFIQNDTDYDTFTPEDDQIILEYINSKAGNEPFADLSVLLKRPRLSILKRYRRLQSINLYHKGRIMWNEDLCRELIEGLLRVTKSDRLSDLKNRHITMQEWESIAKKMGIPPLKLRRVWCQDIYTRLINPLYDEQFNESRSKLIKILAEDYTDRREIDWGKVAEKFDNLIAPLRLHKMFKDMIRFLPYEKQNDLQACFEHFKYTQVCSKPRYSYATKIFEEIENEERKKR